MLDYFMLHAFQRLQCVVILYVHIDHPVKLETYLSFFSGNLNQSLDDIVAKTFKP